MSATGVTKPANGSAVVRVVAASSNDNVEKFADRTVQEFTMCVLGDLHMQPKDTALFEEAQRQMRALLSSDSGQPMAGARVVQLGDVGGYDNKPGRQPGVLRHGRLVAGRV